MVASRVAGSTFKVQGLSSLISRIVSQRECCAVVLNRDLAAPAIVGGKPCLGAADFDLEGRSNETVTADTNRVGIYVGCGQQLPNCPKKNP